MEMRQKYICIVNIICFGNIKARTETRQSKKNAAAAAAKKRPSMKCTL